MGGETGMAGAEAGGLIGGLTADAWGLVCGQLAELEDLVAVSAVCQGLLQVARGLRKQLFAHCIRVEVRPAVVPCVIHG